MELLFIFLSGLFSIASPGGLIIDLLTRNLLNSEVKDTEQLATRIDNTPSYQLIQGKLDRVRIASRGVQISSLLKIDTLELETDSVDINLNSLETGSLEAIRKSLHKPLQGALRLIITEASLNQTLQSEEVQTQLQKALNRLISRKTGSSTFRYQLLNPRLEFLEGNLIRLQFQLSRLGGKHTRFRELDMNLECQIKVMEGKAIELVKLGGTVNNRPISNRLLQGFAKGVSNRLNFTDLEQNGIFVRLLQLDIDNNQIKLAAFIRMHQEKTTISIQKQSTQSDN